MACRDWRPQQVGVVTAPCRTFRASSSSDALLRSSRDIAPDMVATAEGAQKLFEQAKKVAEGAALMTNTEWECTVLSAVWPVRGNQT